jgi:hypothetical protein
LIPLGDMCPALADFAKDHRTINPYCDGKIQHASEIDAWTHIRALYRNTRAVAGSLRPYRCPTCDAWHVGHISYQHRAQRLAGRSG